MKINVDIDCTPEEARAFLGWPDVRPMQDAMMGVMKERMEQAVGGSDPEQLFKLWFPTGLQGLEQMQRAFFEAAAGGGAKKKS